MRFPTFLSLFGTDILQSLISLLHRLDLYLKSSLLEQQRLEVDTTQPESQKLVQYEDPIIFSSFYSLMI